MDKQRIISFFDACAASWDAEMIRDDTIIESILDNAGIAPSTDVLDVACGTGVLFADYLARGVASLTAVDISPEMISIARQKYCDKKINILCADAEEMQLDSKFDCIVIYNAFPHFGNPDILIENLVSMLKPGGTLTVAHGMSRKMIDKHHSGAAEAVSVGLLHEDDLAALMEKRLKITTKISNDFMYQVTGVNNA